MPLSVTLRGYSEDFQNTVEVNYCYVLIVELEYVFNLRFWTKATCQHWLQRKSIILKTNQPKRLPVRQETLSYRKLKTTVIAYLLLLYSHLQASNHSCSPACLLLLDICYFALPFPSTTAVATGFNHLLIPCSSTVLTEGSRDFFLGILSGANRSCLGKQQTRKWTHHT